MINNLGTSLSELQINFGVLQIDTENSATGVRGEFNSSHVVSWSRRICVIVSLFQWRPLYSFNATKYLDKSKICLGILAALTLTRQIGKS